MSKIGKSTTILNTHLASKGKNILRKLFPTWAEAQRNFGKQLQLCYRSNLILKFSFDTIQIKEPKTSEVDISKEDKKAASKF